MSTHGLTLISHPLCPFVQRSAIVLLEKNVPFERVNVDLSAKPDWFLALSPTGKVPLLKVHQANGEDALIFESMVICEYLNETQDGDSMYADDALVRARQRAWIEFRDADCDAAYEYYAGGTMRNLVHIGCMQKRAEQRIKELDDFLGP